MAQITYEEVPYATKEGEPQTGTRCAVIMIKLANRLGPRQLNGTLKIYAGSRPPFDRNNMDMLPLAAMYRVCHAAQLEIPNGQPVALLPMQFEFFSHTPSDPEFYVMDPLAFALQQNDIVTFRCRLSNLGVSMP